MDAFETYLEKIAERNLNRLGLATLGFYEGNVPAQESHSHDERLLLLNFNGQRVGVLRATAKGKQFLLAPLLEDVAAQVACLFQNKNRQEAMALDKLVEELAEANDDRYHWTGIYLLNDAGMLELAAFRGESTPHMIIPVDRGICGAAVREGKTLNIADVHADSRYLSCSIKTKSEIVVPIFKDGKVVGEIDIDSHLPDAFTSDDEQSLEAYAETIAQELT